MLTSECNPDSTKENTDVLLNPLHVSPSLFLFYQKPKSTRFFQGLFWRGLDFYQRPRDKEKESRRYGGSVDQVLSNAGSLNGAILGEVCMRPLPPTDQRRVG